MNLTYHILVAQSVTGNPTIFLTICLNSVATSNNIGKIVKELSFLHSSQDIHGLKVVPKYAFLKILSMHLVSDLCTLQPKFKLSSVIKQTYHQVSTPDIIHHVLGFLMLRQFFIPLFS